MPIAIAVLFPASIQPMSSDSNCVKFDELTKSTRESSVSLLSDKTSDLIFFKVALEELAHSFIPSSVMKLTPSFSTSSFNN